MTLFHDYVLDRRAPTNLDHVSAYPFLAATPSSVERVLRLPPLRVFYNQGKEGACVGFSLSMMMSVVNFGEAYDARWLWNRAKERDQWADTNPGDDNGTSVMAGCDVLRQLGHVPAPKLIIPEQKLALPEHGILENRWARTVDEVRASILRGIPVTLGINWMSVFDTPELVVDGRSRRHWIGRNGQLGYLRGGHAICCFGASDRLQAVCLVNSWGFDYPLVWMPYSVLGVLLRQNGEASLVTDRPALVRP